jgi:hypothetical protein
MLIDRDNKVIAGHSRPFACRELLAASGKSVESTLAGGTKPKRSGLAPDLDERNTRMLASAPHDKSEERTPTQSADAPTTRDHPAAEEASFLIEADGPSLAKNSPRMAKRPYRRRIPLPAPQFSRIQRSR